MPEPAAFERMPTGRARGVDAGPASAIARERVLPGPPSTWFVVATVALAFLACTVGFALGVVPVERTAAELASPLVPTGIRSARAVSALAAGVLVAATALVGRRLVHSEAVGVLAAALVAVDPLAIGYSRLALPEAIAAGGSMLAFASFLSPRHGTHWLGSAALTVAAFAETKVLLWCLPLGVLMLIRGHIFAAPRHLGWTALQAVGLPALGAILGKVWVGPLDGAACLSPVLWDAALLRALPAPDEGLLLVPGPVTWFAGIAALLSLAGSALVSVLLNFRIARLPGRIQFRLVEELPATRARVLWLAVLAILIPFPLLWLPLLALALAAGIRELSRDAPGFGIVVSLAAVVVAVIVLARLWPFAQGLADADDLARVQGLVPWARVVEC